MKSEPREMDFALPVECEMNFAVPVGRNEFRAPSIFLELAGDEILKGGHRGIGVRTVGADGDDGAVAGGEHHQAHDALAIDFLTILLNEDVRLETVGGFDELRRRAGMDAELVENGEIFFGHEDRLSPRGM